MFKLINFIIPWILIAYGLSGLVLGDIYVPGRTQDGIELTQNANLLACAGVLACGIGMLISDSKRLRKHNWIGKNLIYVGFAQIFLAILLQSISE
jgi:hypothetical protein